MRKATVIIAVCVISLPTLAQRRRRRVAPVPPVLVNAAQCQRHLIGGKRASCMRCINDRGKFHPEGATTPGVCRGLPPPPPPRYVAPPPPPLPADVLVRPGQCNAIRRPGKRERCRRCLHGRNWFFTQGNRWGYCKPRPAPPPPKLAAVVVRPEQCDPIRRPGKRERCRRCVSRGGLYFPQGIRWGFCKVRRRPPPPPPRRDVREHRRDIREDRRERREDRRERRKDVREDRRERRKDRREDRREKREDRREKRKDRKDRKHP